MRPKPEEAFRARPAMRRPEHVCGAEYVCIGEFTSDDGTVVSVRAPDALSDIVIRYRMMRWNRNNTPDRECVKEALRLIGLKKTNDEFTRMSPKQLEKYWRNLDCAVRIEIERAAFVLNERFVAGYYCLHTMHGKKNTNNLSRYARVALESMKRKEPGRWTVNYLAVAFAGELAVHWYETKKAKPTVRVTDYEPTEFQKWTEVLFKLAGYPTSDIYKNLRDGVKAAKLHGRIPRFKTK